MLRFLPSIHQQPAACLLPPLPHSSLWPADAQQEAAAAREQVLDLQATLDRVITELDIARSLLSSQRQQELQHLEQQHRGGGGRDGQYYQPQQQRGGDEGASSQQRIVAFPVQLGSLQFDPQASACPAS